CPCPPGGGRRRRGCPTRSAAPPASARPPARRRRRLRGRERARANRLGERPRRFNTTPGRRNLARKRRVRAAAREAARPRRRLVVEAERTEGQRLAAVGLAGAEHDAGSTRFTLPLHLSASGARRGSWPAAD